MRFLSRLGVLLFAGTTALLGAATAAVADDTPPPLEEEYDYPGADKIYAERGIRLKKGDGNITLTDCVTGVELLQVRARSVGPFCFNVRGNTGFLTMELSEAFLIIGGPAHNTGVHYTIKNTPHSVNVPPRGWQGIGEGEGPDKSATLLEIRTQRAS